MEYMKFKGRSLRLKIQQAMKIGERSEAHPYRRRRLKAVSVVDTQTPDESVHQTLQHIKLEGIRLDASAFLNSSPEKEPMLQLDPLLGNEALCHVTKELSHHVADISSTINNTLCASTADCSNIHSPCTNGSLEHSPVETTTVLCQEVSTTRSPSSSIDSCKLIRVNATCNLISALNHNTSSTATTAHSAGNHSITDTSYCTSTSSLSSTYSSDLESTMSRQASGDISSDAPMVCVCLDECVISRRMLAVKEILAAEQVYLDQLSNVIRCFIDHAEERHDMFPVKLIQLLFGNIKELKEHTEAFLSSLRESCLHETVETNVIGRCFLLHHQSFLSYITYCNNHPRAVAKITELNKILKYKHFFEACRLLHHLPQLPLESLLLTPVQKICKYPLQISQLLKYTCTHHPDYTALQQALELMKSRAQLVNDSQFMSHDTLVSGLRGSGLSAWQATVQGWRGPDLSQDSAELLYSGDLVKLSRTGRRVQRCFFLFNNQLIQCRRDEAKKCLMYRNRLRLRGHSMKSSSTGNSMIIYDSKGGSVVTLEASSSTSCTDWCQAFNKAVNEHENRKPLDNIITCKPDGHQ